MPPLSLLGEGGCGCLPGPHGGLELGADPLPTGATLRPSKVGVPLLHVAAPLRPVAVACGCPGVVRGQTAPTAHGGQFCHAELLCLGQGQVDHGVLPWLTRLSYSMGEGTRGSDALCSQSVTLPMLPSGLSSLFGLPVHVCPILNP